MNAAYFIRNQIIKIAYIYISPLSASFSFPFLSIFFFSLKLICYLPLMLKTFRQSSYIWTFRSSVCMESMSFITSASYDAVHYIHTCIHMDIELHPVRCSMLADLILLLPVYGYVVVDKCIVVEEFCTTTKLNLRQDGNRCVIEASGE